MGEAGTVYLCGDIYCAQGAVIRIIVLEGEDNGIICIWGKQCNGSLVYRFLYPWVTHDLDSGDPLTP